MNDPVLNRAPTVVFTLSRARLAWAVRWAAGGSIALRRCSPAATRVERAWARPSTFTFDLELNSGELTLPLLLRNAVDPIRPVFSENGNLAYPAILTIEPPSEPWLPRVQGKLDNLSTTLVPDGLEAGYAHHETADSGVMAWSDTFAVTDTVDDAGAWIEDPWLRGRGHLRA